MSRLVFLRFPLIRAPNQRLIIPDTETQLSLTVQHNLHKVFL